MGVAALGEHGRAVQAQRRPGDGVAAVRRDARRVRPRRGRRRRRRRVARARPGARRDADRRDHRRRADRRRVPHQRPGADRPRPDPGDDLGAAQRRASRPTRSTTSSPTARPRQLNDVDRDAGDQGGLRRPRLQGRDQLAEVDDRPPRRRRRDRLARWRPSGPSATGSSRRPPTSTRPIPSATSTTCRSSRARRRSRRSRSTASGSAARTRSRSSGRSRPSARSRRPSNASMRGDAASCGQGRPAWPSRSRSGPGPSR